MVGEQPQKKTLLLFKGNKYGESIFRRSESVYLGPHPLSSVSQRIPPLTLVLGFEKHIELCLVP